jgi:hypothetical protein
MDRTPELYADGIGGISLTEGMVRIELVSLLPNAVEPNRPTPEVRQRLIMTPQGFLQAHAAMQNLLEKLEEAGIVQRNPPRAVS